jgi:hypothetical protein
MGVDDDLDQFVRQHAKGRPDAHELIDPDGERAADLAAGLPNNVRIAYDSMQAWMKRHHKGSSDNSDKRFGQLLSDYQDDREDYQDSIVSLLIFMKTYVTGRYLLDEFHVNDDQFVVKIKPYRGSDVNADVVTASNYTREKGTSWAGRVSYDADDPLFLERGRGTGTNCTVEFSPGKFERYHRHHPAAPGFAPDEMLYHELVHATRYVAGVIDRVPVDHKYDDAEEYLAIILANMYRSDRGFRPIVFRGDHGIGPGAAVLTRQDAINFLQNPQRTDISPIRIIENFRNSQMRFYAKLAHLPPGQPWFNPVREYDARYGRTLPGMPGFR